MSEAKDKEQRLAEALRANLRRRKAQARGTDDPAGTTAPLPATEPKATP